MVHEVTGSNRGRVNDFFIGNFIESIFLNYSNYFRENFNVTMKINRSYKSQV